MKDQLYGSICRLYDWVERNDYRGYDTFDGLSASIRPLTFEKKFLRQVLQQGVRRFPLNLRPILGIPRERSTKAMGFFARGFMRLYEATGESIWKDKAEFTLQWLVENQSTGYSGPCWGNHFDYQSRSSYVPSGLPSVVWTSLIGHGFLDAYQLFRSEKYLSVAIGSCEHILRDLVFRAEGKSVCIMYFPGQNLGIHNANVLGGGLLARTYGETGTEPYRDLAEEAMAYTAKYQRPDASWYYGVTDNLHWVDNFHTGYVLDSFKHYGESTGDSRFDDTMMRGYHYWKKTFFLVDGTPRYYDHKTLPIDIQCCSQAIDTLVFFADRDPESLDLALRVANWTIEHMQDSTGYFYYRRYSQRLVNKTPTLHWGQATMLCALAGLYKTLLGRSTKNAISSTLSQEQR